MYTCNACGFESDVVKNEETRQYIFIDGVCRSCYYKGWKNKTPDRPFNCTSGEELHDQQHNYDPARVQDVLLNGFPR